MSDLQDVIANTSIKAYNSGYLQGAHDERWRIIELMHELIEDSAEIPWWNPIHKQYTLDLIDLIKGEQK